MIASTIAISGPSIFAAMRSSSCLIVAVVIVGELGSGRGRLVDVLAEQVVIEDFPGDGRGGAGAEPGVLDQHRERDLRVVRRSERDEERVVAQALGGVRLGVLLVFL